MNDYISRKVALDAIDEAVDEFDDYHENDGLVRAEEIIADLPDGWIPCGVKLPNDYDSYLVTDYDYFIDVAFYDGVRWWYRDCKGEPEVSAWMPLPQPYKGGQDG